ncbi:MAG TPA: hypothetical protein VKS60_24305 [Stellaceae bacterium]|nr:hypothetical protein [Stellaceae bacterium]
MVSLSLRASAITGVFLCLCLIGGRAEAASFSCSAASSPEELLICGDPGLNELDGRLGAAYQKYLATLAGASRSQVVHEESDWIARTGRACGFTPTIQIDARNRPALVHCLFGEMNERLALLKAQLTVSASIDAERPKAADQPSPTSLPPRPQPAHTAPASPPVFPAESGHWIALSRTAVAIMGDIDWTDQGIRLGHAEYATSLVRDLNAGDLALVGNLLDDDHPIAGRLYRTAIPGALRLVDGNTICGGAAATWLIAITETGSSTERGELGLAFFKGDREPDFQTLGASRFICGTFRYFSPLPSEASSSLASPPPPSRQDLPPAEIAQSGASGNTAPVVANPSAIPDRFPAPAGTWAPPAATLRQVAELQASAIFGDEVTSTPPDPETEQEIQVIRSYSNEPGYFSSLDRKQDMREITGLSNGVLQKSPRIFGSLYGKYFIHMQKGVEDFQGKKEDIKDIRVDTSDIADGKSKCILVDEVDIESTDKTITGLTLSSDKMEEFLHDHPDFSGSSYARFGILCLHKKALYLVSTLYAETFGSDAEFLREADRESRLESNGEPLPEELVMCEMGRWGGCAVSAAGYSQLEGVEVFVIASDEASVPQPMIGRIREISDKIEKRRFEYANSVPNFSNKISVEMSMSRMKNYANTYFDSAEDVSAACDDLAVTANIQQAEGMALVGYSMMNWGKCAEKFAIKTNQSDRAIMHVHQMYVQRGAAILDQSRR